MPSGRANKRLPGICGQLLTVVGLMIALQVFWVQASAFRVFGLLSQSLSRFSLDTLASSKCKIPVRSAALALPPA